MQTALPPPASARRPVRMIARESVDTRARRAWTIIGFTAASVGFAAAAVAGGLTHCSIAALIGVYGLIVVGVGSAPLQPLSQIDIWTRLTASCIIGFGTLLCGAAVMADIRGLWQPLGLAIAIGVVALVLHGIGIRRVWPEVGRLSRRRLLGRSLSFRGFERLSLLLTAVGTALWLVPAFVVRQPEPGIWGLLKVMGPAWYAGLVVVIVAFVIGRNSGRCAALATFSFAIATTLTPALVYGAPSENTAAKQMQLTAYVLQHHHFAVTSGIYPAYSALFSGLAWVCQLMGIHGRLSGPYSLLQVATFWPVLVVLLRVIELRMLAGRILQGTSRQWTAVMLVLLTDTLIYYYYSPQAIGYVLAIATLAVVVKGHADRPFTNRSTFFLLALGGLALAPTHELSPYIAAGAMLILAVFGQAPWWSCPTILVPALAWVGVVHKAVSGSFSFSSLFALGNFRAPSLPSEPGQHRLAIVGYNSHSLLAALLILIALALIGFVARIRTRAVWGYLFCPAVGLALIAINPYGNEGIFRAALFGIPWLAVLAMHMPRLGRRLGVLRRSRARGVVIAGLMIVLLATFLVAEYGMDANYELRKSDLQVADFLATPPASANNYALGVEPTYEDVGDDQYTPADALSFTIPFTSIPWSSVATVPAIKTNQPTVASADALASMYASVASSESRQAGQGQPGKLYIVWSQSMLEYTATYGVEAPSILTAWLRALQRSTSVTLVRRFDQSYVFRVNQPLVSAGLQALRAVLRRLEKGHFSSNLVPQLGGRLPVRPSSR